jgi:hypothetical protein
MSSRDRLDSHLRPKQADGNQDSGGWGKNSSGAESLRECMVVDLPRGRGFKGSYERPLHS